MSNYSVNDKPTAKASPDNPVDGVDDVILTCDEATNEADPTYEWYKSDVKEGPNTKEYNIGKLKAASGSYTCAVVGKAHTGTSVKSNAVEVKILCKYH